MGANISTLPQKQSRNPSRGSLRSKARVLKEQQAQSLRDTQPEGQDQQYLGPMTAHAFQGAHDLQINGGIFTVAGGNSIVNVYAATQPGSDVTTMAPWLTSVNYQTIQADTLSKRTPRTCEWVLGTNKFKNWLASDGGILWGTGIPGAGKTVLSSIVINYLQEFTNNRDDVCLIFAYCRYTDPIPVKEILAAILRQYLERYPRTIQFIKSLYDHHHTQGTHPSHGELFALLQQIANSNLFSKSYYVLDGLDEAPDDVQIDILSCLSSLTINFFITSRPLALLKDLVPRAIFLEIVVKDPDLELLVAQKIERMPTLRRMLSAELKAQVVSTILQKSCGMFLLASLQVEMLRDCLSIRDLRESLESLPAGVTEMYAETMRRIEMQSERHVQLAKRVLVWLVYSGRSPSIQQLQYAVAVCPKTLEFDPDRVVHEDTLLSVCCGLVMIEPRSKIVRLIHYTASDALKRALLSFCPDPYALLASTCVARLAQCQFHTKGFNQDIDRITAFSDHPFLGYSERNWVIFAHQCHTLPSRVIDFIRQCRRYPHSRKAHWPRVDWLNSVHIAALFNFPEVLKLVLNDTLATDPDTPSLSVDVNTRTELGTTPLILATTNGHREVVHLLLEFASIDINAADHQGTTPLICACSKGHEDLVSLLFEHDTTLSDNVINVNIKDSNGKSALFHASYGGYSGIVKRLLEVDGIDVNSRDACGDTALITAAFRGKEEVVKALLGFDGLDVNAASGEGMTALMEASRTNNLGVVKTLLEVKGIDVNAKNPYGQSVLLQASFHGHVEIVKLLTQVEGIDVDTTDNEGQTALKVAASGGEAPVVKILLALDRVDSNVADLKGRTALMAAASRGYTEIVKMLLNVQGIDPDARDSEGMTASELALSRGRGCEAVAQLLARVGTH